MEDASIAFQIDFLEALHRKDPSFTEAIELLGNLYSHTGRYQDSLKMDLKLIKIEPSNPYHYYNLACSYALCQKKDLAFKALHKAIDLGYEDGSHLRQDQDLTDLRSDPRFRELVKRLQARHSA